MVNLTRIYTRTGDKGTTALGDMSRTAKTDLRISAYADANEANAVIGTAIALGKLDEEVVKVLVRVQNDLFDVGADLSTPVVEDSAVPAAAGGAVLRRQAGDRLRPLPGGTGEAALLHPAGRHARAALLHQACTVVRRAERSTWAALEVHGETMNPLTATYLNRLSDLLFILERTANKEVGDVLWVPGGDR